MDFDCSAGAAFRLSGHLYVVIVDLLEPPDHVIVTFLTTKKPHSDPTVVLGPEDHSFIKHDTVINYAQVKIVPREDIMHRVKDRIYEAQDRFSQSTIERIQYGLLTSPRTPKRVKEIYASHLSAQKRL